MRLLTLLVLLIVPVSLSGASASVLHAAFEKAEPAFERDAALCGEGPSGSLVGYVGAQRVCADVLIGDLRDDGGVLEGRVDEVILLTSRPNVRTLYRVDAERRPVLSIGNLVRREGDPLTIRGQRGPDDIPLVWFKGLDLLDTVCSPDRVADEAACRAGQPVREDGGAVASWERRYEMTSLSLIEDVEISRALRRPSEFSNITGRGSRAYCVRLKHVRGIVLSDLGFEDCWISAVLVVNSREVTLQRARIHGSTFGVLAVATSGMELDAHTYQILESHWIQSPAAYRPQAEPCENPHLDLSCAVDIWDDLPWGVTHHHIWRPFNGALFASHNIAGNVLLENNLLERAYNGIRMISERPGTGRNVEVRGNVFRFLRDNAVEPEDRADGWVVKHNVFQNVHAWMSTDGVLGGSMYVFGNLGWYDPEQMPGQNCRDGVRWEDSPRFTGMAGDAGRYLLIDTSYDPTSVACLGHSRGAILKTGDKRRKKFPYFERISIFNNSWRTRSPLFSSKHASPLSHFNNAIAFTGCGLDGPWHCRQVPAPLEFCEPGLKRTRGRVGAQQFWTDDGGALVADCFTFTPGPAEPDERALETRTVSHAFCRDAYNRGFEAPIYSEDGCRPLLRHDLFASASGEDLSLAARLQGCRVRLAEGEVLPDCEGDAARKAPQVGALQDGGRLFDMEIPGAGCLGSAFRP